MRGINSSRWSQTYKTWLVPFDKASVDKIKVIFSDIGSTDEECRKLFGLASQNIGCLQQDLVQSVDSKKSFEREEVFLCQLNILKSS